MSTWDALRAELDAWQDAGRVAPFWWRDDDAVARTPLLERLIALSERCDVPLHLAVIPAKLEPSLTACLTDHQTVYTLQHAFAHVNHEPAPFRASEIGINRPLDLQLADLKTGWDMLTASGIPRLLPVMVPPWNRIAPETVTQLPSLGFTALSAYGPRNSASGILEINAHLDPLRWKTGPKFAGTEKLLRGLIARLQDVRSGAADAAEPTGICTHHLVTGDATWDFLDTLFDTLTDHPAAAWHGLAHYLPERETADG